MNETVRHQQRRYMRYNLVAFTIIFGVFASIAYMQIYSSLFSRLDEDLYLAREKIQQAENYIDHQMEMSLQHERFWEQMQVEGAENDVVPPGDGDMDREMRGEPDKGDMPKGGQPPASVPARVQVIIRDIDGGVQNGYAIGRMFWESTIEAIPFSPEWVDAIQGFSLEDGSSYRSISFVKSDSAGAAYFVQLLLSSDGEQAIVDSFVRILIVCVLVFVVVSIAASYVLSQKTMGPLVRSWERQTEFVENASHELRTPLTIIQNKLEALLVTPNATVLDKADNIAISLSETRRLSKLTTDLMTLARADSKELQLQKETFTLDELVQTVVKPYSELAEAQGKTMTLDLASASPISADRARIHELMVILLDNALKYTGEGDGIRVSTQRKESRLVIRVADTGIGIRDESKSRVFDRFYREDKARSRENGGTGLGLSIARWIVDSHQGAITAEKNQPRGTVFEVRLPR